MAQFCHSINVYNVAYSIEMYTQTAIFANQLLNYKY